MNRLIWMIACAGLFACTMTYAQETLDESARENDIAENVKEEGDSAAHAARLAFARSPMLSMPIPVSGDTIDTERAGVKIIIAPDYTWRYIKDPSVAMASEVFTKDWDEKKVNPYENVGFNDLPLVWSMWIVDSLGQYHCPNTTAVRSGFGIRHRRRHQGVDLPLKMGDPVYAAFDGKVRLSSYVGGYGNLIILRHENGLETFYGHLSKSNVQPGDWVHAGQVIGQGGSTGRSTGPHLHFETRYKGYAFDPCWLIDFPTGILRHRLFVLRRRYFNPSSKYVQSEDEEEEIVLADEADRLRLEEEKKAAEAAAMKYHTVRNGDTLSGIAKKYGTTVGNICRMNNIKSTTILRVGKRLRVR